MRAIDGGLVGAAVMSVLTVTARPGGVPIDFESMLGTVAGGPPTRAKRTAGLAVQLINGGLLTLPYAAALDRLPYRPAWVVGATLGAVPAAAPAVHPKIPRRLPEPGPFFVRQGAAAMIVFIAIHVVYGAIVGAACGVARQRRR